jgi:hypothetical protein
MSTKNLTAASKPNFQISILRGGGAKVTHVLEREDIQKLLDLSGAMVASKSGSVEGFLKIDRKIAYGLFRIPTYICSEFSMLDWRISLANELAPLVDAHLITYSKGKTRSPMYQMVIFTQEGKETVKDATAAEAKRTGLKNFRRK